MRSFESRRLLPRFNSPALASEHGAATTTQRDHVLASNGWRQPFVPPNSDCVGPRHQGLRRSTRLSQLLRPRRWKKSLPRLNSSLDESLRQRQVKSAFSVQITGYFLYRGSDAVAILCYRVYNQPS